MLRTKWFLTTIIILLTTGVSAQTANRRQTEDNPIVIVSSYNPDVKNINDNVAAFYEECTQRGFAKSIALEDIHAQNLPESTLWKNRIWDVLKKYYANGKRPAVVVLLGNEAISAYFSLDKDSIKATPVIVGMAGSTTVRLPDSDDIDLKTWSPKPYDMTKDFNDYNIVGGRLYHYDIQKNIQLIKYFYAKRDTLVFITDNTLGGVIQQATFKEKMKDSHGFVLRYIDGRTMSFLDVNDYISRMSGGSVLLVATWRIDSSNRFLVRNTTYTFGASNPNIPTFTLSDVGMGHWPVAGYSPQYQVIGKYLADDVIHFLETGVKKKPTLIANKYIFDYDKLAKLRLSLHSFPAKYEMVNRPISTFEEYKSVILTVTALIAILTCCLFVSLWFLRKSKKLQRELILHGQELVRMKETAEEANIMKSRFIADMSHEIRTPLNAVIGFAQILTSTEIDSTSEEKAEFGHMIMLNSELLLKLVNDTLDISKIDAGKMQFDIQKVDIVNLCNMAATSTQAKPKQGVNICTDIPIDSLMVDTDKDRLLQVLSNLLNNAKKCTAHGNITIGLKANKDDDIVEISVTDTGCGIPAEKAETIFERFKKLDTFKQGTGLGLAISRSIIEQLGGNIWVDKTYTDGARFIVTHPIHSTSDSEETVTPPQ